MQVEILALEGSISNKILSKYLNALHKSCNKAYIQSEANKRMQALQSEFKANH